MALNDQLSPLLIEEMLNPVRYWLQTEADVNKNFGDYLTELFLSRLFLAPAFPADAYHIIGSTITEQTAGRDLKALVDAGYLEPHGEKRGRFYVATPTLREVWLGVRGSRAVRDDADPFAG